MGNEQMTFTKEDIERLVPEAKLEKLVELIVIVCGEEPGDRIEADLAHALLTTRRQLEIAREALEWIATYKPGDNGLTTKDAITLRGSARYDLESIKKVEQS